MNVTEVSQAPLLCGSDLPRTRRDFLLRQQATFRDHISKAHCTDTMVKCTLFSTTVMKKPINQQSIPVLWNKTEHKNLECYSRWDDPSWNVAHQLGHRTVTTIETGLCPRAPRTFVNDRDVLPARIHAIHLS